MTLSMNQVWYAATCAVCVFYNNTIEIIDIYLVYISINSTRNIPVPYKYMGGNIFFGIHF